MDRIQARRMLPPIPPRMIIGTGVGFPISNLIIVGSLTHTIIKKRKRSLYIFIWLVPRDMSQLILARQHLAL